MTNPAPPTPAPPSPLQQVFNGIFDSTGGALTTAGSGNSPGDTVGAAGQAGGALVTQGLAKLGITLNAINVVLNTLLYGGMGLLGGVMVYKGVRLLVTELPGASGVGGLVGDTVGAGVGVAAATGRSSLKLGKIGSALDSHVGRLASRVVPELKVGTMLAGHSPIHGPVGP